MKVWMFKNLCLIAQWNNSKKLIVECIYTTVLSSIQNVFIFNGTIACIWYPATCTIQWPFDAIQCDRDPSVGPYFTIHCYLTWSTMVKINSHDLLIFESNILLCLSPIINYRHVTNCHIKVFVLKTIDENKYIY